MADGNNCSGGSAGCVTGNQLKASSPFSSTTAANTYSISTSSYYYTCVTCGQLVMQGGIHTCTGPGWTGLGTITTGQWTVQQPAPAADVHLRCDERRTCPKCDSGNKHLDLRYCGKTHDTCGLRCARRDHIHATCSRCKHEFLLLAADAPTTDEEDTVD